MDKAKVIGIQNVEFTGRDGNAVVGVSLYTAYEKYKVVGLASDKIFISSSHQDYEIAKSLKLNDSIDYTFKRNSDKVERLFKI